MSLLLDIDYIAYGESIMITVLMATYNGGAFIRKQLDSIRNQSVKVDRVIILDDCSTDDTFKILQNYIEEHSLKLWEVLQNESNQGHYQTFINLTRLVDEGMAFFSDQDDIWDLNKVEVMLSQFENENVAMVFCKSRMIDENDCLLMEPSVTNKVQKYSVQDLLRKWPSGYQTAYRVDVLKDILNQGYDSCPHFQFHDVLFGMLACVYGDVIEMDVILDSHRLHSRNATLTINSRSLENSLSHRLNYYQKMYNRYGYVSQVASTFDRDDEKEIAKCYHDLYIARYNFVKTPNFKSLVKIFKLKRFYNGIRGFGSDVIYAFRLNEIMRLLLKRIRG